MSGDFWSRRREAVAAEAELEARAAEQAEIDKAQADLDALPDEEILAKYDLPDPDSLDTPDAVKDFLSHGLPQRLKTRALRRLWRLNPILANVDGLVDYGEDYTDAATVIEGMQTAYQVGKGMLAHVEAMAQDEAPDSDETPVAAEEETPDSAPDADAVMVDLAPEQDDQPVPASEPVTLYAQDDDIPSPPSLNRRMTFQFESAT